MYIRDGYGVWCIVYIVHIYMVEFIRSGAFVQSIQYLYILLCVHYMTRRDYKRLCRCGAYTQCSILYTFVYSQPTSVRVYTLYFIRYTHCILYTCIQARRNRETCCYVNSWIIFQWEKCIWWNKNKIGRMYCMFAFRAIMLTVNESKWDGNTCRAENAFWIRIWNSNAHI